jgi:hypothetical protein
LRTTISLSRIGSSSDGTGIFGSVASWSHKNKGHDKVGKPTSSAGGRVLASFGAFGGIACVAHRDHSQAAHALLCI